MVLRINVESFSLLLITQCRESRGRQSVIIVGCGQLLDCINIPKMFTWFWLFTLCFYLFVYSCGLTFSWLVSAAYSHKFRILNFIVVVLFPGSHSPSSLTAAGRADVKGAEEVSAPGIKIKCSKCGKHRQKDSEGRFKCPICSLKFSDEVLLKHHVKVHIM